jgi:type IV secretory pathway VirJ component
MALLLLLPSVWPARADDPVGGLAEAPLSLPAGSAQGLVFLFSGEAGPDAALQATAARITTLGAAVTIVDLRDYLRRVDATLNADCLYLVAEIEAVSRRIQSRLGRARYFAPIVAGTGSGGTLALLALAQAPDATLAGAASDGFGTVLPTDRPLCPGAEATRIDGGYSYAPTMRWPGFVRVGAGPSELAVARDWLARSGLPPETVSVSDPAAPLADRLAALLEAPIRAQQAETTALGQLPIIELPVEQPGRLMAVVLSGDGGWRDLDEEIGGYMQKAGVPVIGLDSLRYFWRHRTPDELAGDLGRIMRHYRQAWDKPDVVLVGYSFGADVLPFAVNRLPADLRKSVRQISFLALSHWADFEIHLSEWLSSGPRPESIPTLPELGRLDLTRVQCIYGEDEDGNACSDPALAATERIKTSGGHHFDGDYEALARAILAGAERRG